MLLIAQAANGQEAIAQFRTHRPDITLMDVRLPGINGTDALISIRGEFSDARIIILTSSDGDAEINRALQGRRRRLRAQEHAEGRVARLDPVRSLRTAAGAGGGGIPARGASRR